MFELVVLETPSDDGEIVDEINFEFVVETCWFGGIKFDSDLLDGCLFDKDELVDVGDEVNEDEDDNDE